MDMREYYSVFLKTEDASEADEIPEADEAPETEESPKAEETPEEKTGPMPWETYAKEQNQHLNTVEEQSETKEDEGDGE